MHLALSQQRQPGLRAAANAHPPAADITEIPSSSGLKHLSLCVNVSAVESIGRHSSHQMIIYNGQLWILIH